MKISTNLMFEKATKQMTSSQTNLAKSQIIQQAATAMLAQANQSAQSVLALLK